jgi:hypothetical protein
MAKIGADINKAARVRRRAKRISAAGAEARPEIGNPVHDIARHAGARIERMQPCVAGARAVVHQRFAAAHQDQLVPQHRSRRFTIIIAVQRGQQIRETDPALGAP